MKEELRTPGRAGKLWIYALAVLVVYVYHLVRYADAELWNSIYSVYYVFLIPALVAVHFSIRGFRGPIEEKLFILYWIWIFISRLLNGDFFLTRDGDMVLNMGLSCVLLGVCQVLKGRGRQAFLDAVSLVTAGYFSLLGLVGLYAVLYHKELINPLNGSQLTGFEGTISRLTMFYKSSNEVCMWFFLGFFLLVYLFFRWKNLLWRLAAILGALINYLALTMTFSRNGMLSFSFGIGLLAAALGLRYIAFNKLSRKVLASLLLFCLFTVAAYSSFDAGTALMRSASNAVMSGESAEEEEEVSASAQGLAPEETAETSQEQTGTVKNDMTYTDERSLLDDSERLMIYESIIPTMEQEPLRLLRGCLCEDVMEISNQVMPKTKPHFHNSYLQAFNITGLPGLGLLLAFSLLLVVKIVRLFFSSAPMEQKVLLMILTGIFSYNLLETSLFVAADTRAFIFYIIAGAVLACYQDRFPKAAAEGTGR